MEQNQYKRITLKVSTVLYRVLKKLSANNDWTVPVQARRTLEKTLAQNIDAEELEIQEEEDIAFAEAEERSKTAPGVS